MVPIRKYSLEIITVVVVLGFIGIFLWTGAGTRGFPGSDEIGSQKIAELTGRPVDSYQPLVPQYVPPGKEIEGTLFALQAAAGGIVVGLIFGYWLGRREQARTA